MKKLQLIILTIFSLTCADAVMCPVSKSYPGNLLRHTSSSITVLLHGQIAETIVESEFRNEWNQQTGGVYSFPLPFDANATGLWFDYKGQYFQAVLKEIPQVTNPGTGEGGFAAELNQYLGKNNISFKIDTIPPGAVQHIILRYIQKTNYNSGLITYSYPLNSEKFQPQPVDYLSITVQIKKHSGIKSYFSSSHPDGWLTSDTTGDFLTLKYSEDKSYLQQDFNFHYETSYASFSNETTAGIGSDTCGYFISAIYPGSHLDSTSIFPQNIAFCIDASRSMSGSSLKAVCESVKKCLSSLKPNDLFTLISFDDAVITHLNGVSPSSGNISKAITVLDSISKVVGTNGTNLNTALNNALFSFTNESLLNNVIVFTDGFTAVTPEQIINTKHAGIYPVGIGTDVSRERLEAIANYHNGFATFVDAGQTITAVIQDLIHMINSPIIKQIKIVTEGSTVTDLLPETSCYAFYHGKGLLLIGKYTTGKLTTIGLTGKSITGDSSQVFSINLPSDTLNQNNMCVERLWVAEKIRSIERQIDVYSKSSQLRPELIKISLKYGVKCRYTSYWADYSNVYNGELPGEFKTGIDNIKLSTTISKLYRFIFNKGILSLHFTVPYESGTLRNAEIILFDVNGSVIARLFKGDLHAGTSSFTWDLKNRGIATGTYFIVTKIGKNVFADKFTLMK